MSKPTAEDMLGPSARCAQQRLNTALGQLITLPATVKERIESCVAGSEGPDFAIDAEARSHGAIALMGTIGAIWGLRPDGTLWQFDEDFAVPLAPLPKEQEIVAVMYGVERHPWLSPLVPDRPDSATTCATCQGQRKFSVAVGHAMCEACSGLGWLP